MDELGTQTASRTSQYHEAQEASSESSKRRDFIKAKDTSQGSHFDRTIPGHPAMKRIEGLGGVEAELFEPEISRANIAASVEAPNGTMKNHWAETHKEHSVLEQHCLFWDQDGDGIIWPLDTFRGFHALGYHLILSVFAVFIIHFGFAWFTMGWPDPLFRLKLKRMHRAKHGSDSGSYDQEGRFVPARFELIFSKYDKGQKGGLTFREGLQMVHGNRMVWDPTGWTAALLEWMATYILAWPADGVVSKEFMRTIYDGSVFFEIAKQERKRSRAPFSGLFHHND